MPKSISRAVLYAKDIMGLTGKKKTYCYQLLKNIKVKNNKEHISFISIDEFCEYTGINKEHVINYIK